MVRTLGRLDHPLRPFVCSRYGIADVAKDAAALGIRSLGVSCGAGPHRIRSMAEACGRTPPTGRDSADRAKHAFFGTDPRPNRENREHVRDPRSPRHGFSAQATDGGNSTMGTIAFIHDTQWRDLPEPVRSQARRCLLDTLGAALGGRRTELSRLVHDFAARAYGGRGAGLWLDGRPVSPPGAALANGMTIDSLDIHDGSLPVKGHAGAAVVPAALATVPVDGGRPVSGQELLTTLVIGYEVALRAGVALHATACDYHTSGAWNALGCAAVAARALGLGADQTRHALGIAEYHGPRSQMMRCIDHPTMLKDGSGWGAMTGVSAAMLAHAGFTGAPAVTVEAPETAATWADLGSRWRIGEQFFKPWAVCRWAQPAIVGALALQRAHAIPLAAIERIQVITFHQATRLARRRPTTTEEAQYGLPFPVAAALVHGQLGLTQLSGVGLQDPRVLRLADRIELVDDPVLSARFPAERVARVRIETANGSALDSGEVPAPWDAAAPPTDAELIEKFRWLASDSVSSARADELLDVVWTCADVTDVGRLSALLAAPCAGPRRVGPGRGKPPAGRGEPRRRPDPE